MRVAFITGDDQPQRVALLGPEPFAVLAVDHQYIIQAFFHRNTAGHCCAIRAFCNDPLGLRLNPDFL
ncbi:hypothetical protein D3C84_1226890 [compost metagenome]